MTRREALQQVCFAIGAYVTCARSRTLKILPFKIIDAATGIYDQTLDETHKGLDSPTQLRKAMTALDIAANRYEWSSTDVQSLYSRTLGVGIYTITVDASVVNLDYSSSTATYIIIDDGLWWVKVQILVAGTFVIESFFSSSRVSERKFIINDIVPPKTPANVLTISNALLLTPENSGVVKSDFVLPAIQHVYSYYLQRVSQKTRLFGLNASAGDSVAIDAQGDTVYGMIERAEFDLTGGFVAQIEIVGDVDRSAQSVKYNNSSSKFTYNGFPNTNSDAQHYGGDIRYSSNGTTGNVQFYFIGYQFKFIYRQFAGGGEGSVGIYVDDVLATTIDQNGTTVYQKEWTSPVYANTYHKVKVQKVGTTGTANIDAVEVFYK